MAASSTKVKVKCVSKKQAKQWGDSQPHQHTIELEVPYDTNSIYFKLSGGTNLELRTINSEVADMFKIGDDYDIIISPALAE